MPCLVRGVGGKGRNQRVRTLPGYKKFIHQISGRWKASSCGYLVVNLLAGPAELAISGSVFIGSIARIKTAGQRDRGPSLKEDFA